MTSRLKEDERNERTIRNFLKLPENRRCINCNSLGSQYVCTNFWTFVCTTCSGIHREFTHRVKSVSMAKFTSQEVTSLEGGGNANAKKIYFKEWDPRRQYYPDSSNIVSLRDFIRNVYVNKKYTGEKSFVGPSPSGRIDDKSSKYSNEEKRIYEDCKFPDHKDMSSPPIMRVSSFRIIKPPKANGHLRTTMRSLSSNSFLASSSDKYPVAKVRRESSLIDFNPQVQLPQIQQSAPSFTQLSTSSNNNWAKFDSFQDVKLKQSHAPSNTNLLDVFTELSPVLAQQSSPFDTSTTKKELPKGLFASNYSSFGAPPQYGMGFNMQFNVPMHMPQSSNAFDAHESSSLQFPSMTSLQGALPNIYMASPSGIHHTSSLGRFSPTWMPTQSTQPRSFYHNQQQSGGNPFA